MSYSPTMSAVAPEKGGGIMTDLERTISNSFVNVDGAVSVPPNEKSTRVVAHDGDEESQRQVDDSSDATAVDEDKSGGAAPDGGMQAWLVVLGAWCASFCSYGWINSTSFLSLFLFFFSPLPHPPLSSSSFP